MIYLILGLAVTQFGIDILIINALLRASKNLVFLDEDLERAFVPREEWNKIAKNMLHKIDSAHAQNLLNISTLRNQLSRHVHPKEPNF